MRSFGAVEATSAAQAATVPVKAPSIMRSATNCQGAMANAIRKAVIMAAHMARSTMRLRPRRSAIVPQKGAVMTMTSAPPEMVTPDQSAA